MIKLMLAAIRFYQKYLSPLKIAPSCRFYPSCSAYAYSAISKYGYAGVWIAVRRVLRCNPLCKFGYDPVP